MHTKKYLVLIILIGIIMVLVLLGSCQEKPNNKNLADEDIGVQLDFSHSQFSGHYFVSVF